MPDCSKRSQNRSEHSRVILQILLWKNERWYRNLQIVYMVLISFSMAEH